MTRTQSTLRYLKAQRQAWNTYNAAVKQARGVCEVALQQAEEAYRVADKLALAACEVALKLAFEAYEAAKKQEELKKRR